MIGLRVFRVKPFKEGSNIVGRLEPSAGSEMIQFNFLSNEPSTARSTKEFPLLLSVGADVRAPGGFQSELGGHPVKSEEASKGRTHTRPIAGFRPS